MYEHIFENIYKLARLNESKLKTGQDIIDAINTGKLQGFGKKQLGSSHLWLKNAIDNNDKDLLKKLNTVAARLSSDVNAKTDQAITLWIKKSVSREIFASIANMNLDALVVYSKVAATQWAKTDEEYIAFENKPYNMTAWKDFEHSMIDKLAAKRSKKHNLDASMTASLYKVLEGNEDTDEWVLYQPISFEGDSYLATVAPFEDRFGKTYTKARWCTAADKGYWDHYSRHGNGYYVLRHFNAGHKADEAWQIAFELKRHVECMDKEDNRSFTFLNGAPDSILSKIVCDNKRNNHLSMLDLKRVLAGVDTEDINDSPFVDDFFNTTPEAFQNYINTIKAVPPELKLLAYNIKEYDISVSVLKGIYNVFGKALLDPNDRSFGYSFWKDCRGLSEEDLVEAKKLHDEGIVHDWEVIPTVNKTSVIRKYMNSNISDDAKKAIELYFKDNRANIEYSKDVMENTIKILIMPEVTDFIINLPDSYKQYSFDKKMHYVGFAQIGAIAEKVGTKDKIPVKYILRAIEAAKKFKDVHATSSCFSFAERVIKDIATIEKNHPRKIIQFERDLDLLDKQTISQGDKFMDFIEIEDETDCAYGSILKYTNKKIKEFEENYSFANKTIKFDVFEIHSALQAAAWDIDTGIELINEYLNDHFEYDNNESMSNWVYTHTDYRDPDDEDYYDEDDDDYDE